MSNNINGLREMLFEQMRDLKKSATADDLARVKAINDLAQTLINSAKVEVEAMRVSGGNGTGFIGDSENITPQKLPGKPSLTPIATGDLLKQGNVTRHVMR